MRIKGFLCILGFLLALISFFLLIIGKLFHSPMMGYYIYFNFSGLPIMLLIALWNFVQRESHHSDKMEPQTGLSVPL